jgi:hypothetical protein
MVFFVSLLASECNDEYNYANFPTAPEELKEYIGNSLEIYMDKNIKTFPDFKRKRVEGGEIYYIKDGSFVKFGEFYYPAKDGVWKLHVNKNGIIDEIDFAKINPYKDPAEDLANELNDDLGNLWVKWDGDAYGYKMVPEYTQLHLDDFYLAMDAFIFGSEDDATGLKNSIIDLHFINYTHEVREFIECQKKR